MSRGGIAVVNVSTLVSQDDARELVRIGERQIREHVSIAWSRLPCIPIFFESLEEVPAGMPILMLADEEDVPDAYGHHTQTISGQITGVIGCRIILENGGSVFVGRKSVLAVFTHELIEEGLDPFVNVTATDARGRRWPLEPCDATQGTTYEMEPGKSVSNFCYPQFFNWAPPPGAKFDQNDTIKGSFEIDGLGGYADIEDIDGTRIEIGGDRPDYRPSGDLSRKNRRAARAATIAEDRPTPTV